MRIDKYLSNLGFWSRKEVLKTIKEKWVYINDTICKKWEEKINFLDNITINWKEIIYKKFVYVILNKPKNYVSSNKSEAHYQSYRELLIDCPYRNLLEIVGRLDVDTTWLLLLTNNWDLIHKMIHPKKDIFKTYYIESTHDISKQDLEKLENWIK